MLPDLATTESSDFVLVSPKLTLPLVPFSAFTAVGYAGRQKMINSVYKSPQMKTCTYIIGLVNWFIFREP